MEYVAIRENCNREEQFKNLSKDSEYLNSQHDGNYFSKKQPLEVTAEYVRNEIASGRAIIPSNINFSVICTTVLS